MRPEADRLITGLIDVGRGGSAGEAAIAIQLLVTSLRSNLAELENLVGLRLKTRERLAGLLQAAFQANQEAQRLFAPWLQVMEMQINRSLDEVRKQSVELGTQAGRDLGTSIVLDRSAQAAQRGFSAVVDQLVQTATIGEKPRLPVVGFQLRRNLDDLDAKAKDLDPKLRTLFSDLLGRVRALAIGPDAMLAVRGQELDLIGNAEKLIAENADLAVRLTAAVDRLVAEAETDVSSSARGALSVQRLSARILLAFAILSLLSSILIVWLYVSRNLIRRLMHLSSGMLAIAEGSHHRPINISGSDEVAEMGRVVEVFRRNTLERDELLAEKAQAADRLEQQVKERTAQLAQSVEELRALGDVSAAVNSTIDLQTVLATIVAKAVQLSGTEAGTIFVFDEASQEFRMHASYGMDDALVAAVRGQHIRMGETVVGRAVLQRKPVRFYDLQDDHVARPRCHPARRLPRPFDHSSARRRRDRRRAGGAAQGAGRVPPEHGRSAADLRSAVGSGDPERAPVSRDRGQEPAARRGKPAQVAVPRQHEPRAAHAAQCHPRLHRVDPRQHLRRIAGQGARRARSRAAQWPAPPRPDQRCARPVEDRGRPAHALARGLLPQERHPERLQRDRAIGEREKNRAEGRCGARAAARARRREAAHPDLLNLVGNAIKFTDTGEVSIKGSSANGSFNVAVRDTGPGISAADQAKLFQEFQQADNSITRTKGGTGLGLAISKRIIELHGGRIWVESSPGHGSTFEFTLPVSVAQPASPGLRQLA